MMPTVDFMTRVRQDLKDPEFASFFLQDAIETGNSAEVRTALEAVIEANGWSAPTDFSFSGIATYLNDRGIQLTLHRKAA
jgi:hypothetical protein